MKLVEIGVNNFRGIAGGIAQNKIKFGDANSIFIFGQNNVGKSSFLEAYTSFFHDSITPDDFNHNGDLIEIEIVVEIEEANDKKILENNTGKYENIKKYLENNQLRLRKSWKRGSEKAMDETFDPATKRYEKRAYAGVGAHNVFKSVLLEPMPIKAMPTEGDVQNIVNTVLKDIADRKLKSGKLKKLKDAENTINELQNEVYSKASIDAYKDAVNKIFSELFAGYRIDIDDGKSNLTFSHHKLGRTFKIDFKNLNDDKTDFEKMGHGSIRTAIFLLMLMADELSGSDAKSNKNYLVLFEEPELFLHPKLTKKLRELIYKISSERSPFQVLCASHSPQMIDISKDHTSLVRMVKRTDLTTSLYQVQKEDLVNEVQSSKEQVKDKLYEILRFDPFICESFYADEIVLVEGSTEEIIWRGYFQDIESATKDIFVLNCHSCTNIPFYQRIFSKFRIPYSIICDTDHRLQTDLASINKNGWDGKLQNPGFQSHIQKSIAEQFYLDQKEGIGKKFFVFSPTFEPMHEELAEPYKYLPFLNNKVLSASVYWDKIVQNKEEKEFGKVPIVEYIKQIIH